jgi:hypothetical protein
MAKRQKPINTGKIDSHTFDKDLVEDISGIHLKSNSWTQARNATPNTTRGDLGELSNEQSNKFCAAAPYTINGIIFIDEDKWAIFSTDEVNSEIGIFKETLCEYETLVNDPCLNFSKLHLIKGIAKENFDCSFQLYWDDGENLSRTLNIDNVPWIENCVTDPSGCVTCTPTTQLDCDKIRMAPLVTNPCFRVELGPNGGSMLNGSYFVVGAYLINEQRVSDYSVPSNVQSLFNHIGTGGALEIIVEDMDPDFDEFELVIVEIRAEKVQAKRIGTYSTRQKRIAIDIVDERHETVLLSDIPLRNPIVAKSDAMFRNGAYLLRTGPTNKFDFNYQPLANQINAEWVSVEYDADYYAKGGNNTNYMRDEVYSFFIRWVYDTGDKSPSFHIPGRYEAGRGSGQGGLGGSGVFQADTTDSLPDENGIFNTIWHCQNTAGLNLPAPAPLADGGIPIAKGPMAYWESTERYDDDKPDVWNASSDPIWGSSAAAHDLCGKHIRHHKFPDHTVGASGGTYLSNHYNAGGTKIRIMGVQFNNIKPPLNNDGSPITSIVGYEILRGTREGNKTIAAKGMINNMRRAPGANLNPGQVSYYPNYPYNPQTDERFLGWSVNNEYPSQWISPQHFTFHSPDTNFRDPFLGQRELKLYGELQGVTDGKLEWPEEHPKHQLITNATLMIGLIAGMGFALIKKNGNLNTTKNNIMGSSMHQGASGFLPLIGTSSGTGYWAAPSPVSGFGNVGVPLPIGVIEAVITGSEGVGDTAEGVTRQTGLRMGEAFAGTGPSTFYSSYSTAQTTNLVSLATAGGGYLGPSSTYTWAGGTSKQLPAVMQALQGGLEFALSMSEGADTIIRLIKALTPYEQYALQYNSHGFYSQFPTNHNAGPGNRRKPIENSIYLDADVQDLSPSVRINNLFRGRSVALNIQAPIGIPPCNNGDNSQDSRVKDAVNDPGSGITYDDPTTGGIRTGIASYYAALKTRLRNQYGQIEGIIQVPVSTCMTPIAQTTSDVLFGGDTYVNRYTEKNPMFFFHNWLYGQPDGEEFDYKDYKNVLSPVYWADFFEFDVNQFIADSLTALFTLSLPNPPSDKHSLDGTSTNIFIKRNHYYYLFNSGVRDFFVESEINVDLRDWGDDVSERHYAPYAPNAYSNLPAMFNSDGTIKSGNYYKYDYSLSISKLYNNYTAWGNTHRRSYDPTLAEECFVYRPNRVIYSLPQNQELKKDYWKIFLPLNYKDFKSRLTAVKPINKNGALFLFENESPAQVQGVDTLKTDLNTKITIGDGGLFSMPLQNVLNTDDSYEYGSCQNRLSVVNTASGVFWMSQNQGKIFQIQKGVKEISAFDNKWWLSTYLPYMLTKDFPEFELTDNPVAGIGCQTIYDNEAQIVYFCKRDYYLRDDINDEVTYVSGDDFIVGAGDLPVKLGDPRYFRDASWTISYDPKTEGWISYHDWHPGLLMPAKSNFLSILDDGIWRHNDNCQSYCNYYGVDYPFEVEYATVTPQIVNTLRSVEYFMEVYKYDQNCYDRFHVLDFNFDEAVIYNSEQSSGLLNLNLSPKNNAPEIVSYPRINPTSIDVLFSKVEQKYRFNQFWDITANRGEFNPAAERMIWNTEPNGYVRNLNPNNLDYDKTQTQRKKFRHFKNTVLLRRNVCGNRNMLVSIANNKDLKSPR